MKKLITFLPLLFLFISLQTTSAQSWDKQAIGILPANYGVFDIAIVDENIVWAVAFDQSIGNQIPLEHLTKVIKTIDGGDSWEIFDVNPAQGRISFDITAIDANTAFITTQDYANGSGRGVFKTEDGGDTWVEKFNHVACGVWIRFFNDQDGVVINRQSIATTQDGGESWQVVNSSNIPTFQNGEFTALSSGNNSCQVIGNHIWFGTSNGRVFKSKDKGYTWEVFNSSLGNDALILSVAFRDTLNGIAHDVVNASHASTTDGGESWNTITPGPGISISNIAFVPGTDSVLIGTSDVYTPVNNQVSAYSTDFGKNWEIINSGIAFGGVEFLSPTVGWSSRGTITSSIHAAMYKWESDIFVNSKDIEWDIDYKIFPNPFTEKVFISSPIGFKKYNLITSSGQIIQSKTFDAPFNNSLNLKNLNCGMYILEIITEDGKKVTKKIFKVN